MTNGWVDIKNTDMMLIMGGNPAENHPCGFKWAVEAKRNRNAKTIVVDPRFTRTASQADLFCQIRAGSDLAFLGGLINYAIQNNRVAHEYLVNYTNAAFIIKDGFKLPEDGLFSGFDDDDQDLRQEHLELRGGRQRNRQGSSRQHLGRRRILGRAPEALHESRRARRSCRTWQRERAHCRRTGLSGARSGWREGHGRRSIPLRRRCRRMSPTICRCNIRAASINC